ncbi:MULTISPECIES: hypothetical protein [Micromonospora]|uniref:Uncharacterized protein n=1 Tax=Micromonospora aurantiaca (nom. illeg.) TaxID=47850 RepID=A0A6N3K6Y9_9ACTN|nr:MULTISPECIES: hypothetical protein [Micromonospora]AXH93432.1 hypothetical protein DVH21_27735 [Micromonospora aurantiaca]MDG4752496.1 hypothetical protein [Micromonospora sp. WMMD718]OHX01504.1 hypothetical protein BFV98_00140 [Micromonospora sp. WMMB235]
MASSMRPCSASNLATLAAAPTAAPTALEGPTIAGCDAKLARYRAALDADADPGVVAGWIAETQAEREHAERHQHTPAEEKTNAPARYSEEQIIAVVEELGDLVAALRNAQPEHKLEVYRSPLQDHPLLQAPPEADRREETLWRPEVYD